MAPLYYLCSGENPADEAKINKSTINYGTHDICTMQQCINY